MDIYTHSIDRIDKYTCTIAVLLLETSVLSNDLITTKHHTINTFILRDDSFVEIRDEAIVLENCMIADKKVKCKSGASPREPDDQ